MDGWGWGEGRGEKRNSETKKSHVEDVVKGCCGYWREEIYDYFYFKITHVPMFLRWRIKFFNKNIMFYFTQIKV